MSVKAVGLELKLFSKAIVDVIVDAIVVFLETASPYVPEIYFNFLAP